MKASRFEIYTKNELTGETGWDIKFRYVIGERKEAMEELKNTPYFDCVILYDFTIDIDDIDSEIIGQLINFGWADEII
jgi:hypothetical protein